MHSVARVRLRLVSPSFYKFRILIDDLQLHTVSEFVLVFGDR